MNCSYEPIRMYESDLTWLDYRDHAHRCGLQYAANSVSVGVYITQCVLRCPAFI